MAIVKDFYLPIGTNLSGFFEHTGFEYVSKNEPYLANNLYIKIEKITLNVSEADMVVSFRKEKDTEALMVKEYQFGVSLEEGSLNIFEQGYEYLNSLEEFKGALPA